MKHCMSMQMTYIICTNIYVHMVTVQMVKVVCKNANETLYVYADDLYHLHLHILTYVNCAYGLNVTNITIYSSYTILYPIFCSHTDIFGGGGEKHRSPSPTFTKLFSVSRDVSTNIINSSIT